MKTASGSETCAGYDGAIGYQGVLLRYQRSPLVVSAATARIIREGRVNGALIMRYAKKCAELFPLSPEKRS